jgi:hypothetical protein
MSFCIKNALPSAVKGLGAGIGGTFLGAPSSLEISKKVQQMTRKGERKGKISMKLHLNSADYTP